MPEIRYWVVSQTREVKVAANTARDAVLVAEDEFGGQPKPEEIWGDARMPVKTTDIIVREDF
jgi:hypothetical protein